MNLPDQYLINNFCWMDHPYINKYGYAFLQTSWLPITYSKSPKDDPVCCVFFRCTICHKLYASKSAVDSHTCLPPNQIGTVQFNQAQTFRDLMTLIAVNDLSFKTINSPAFKRFVADLNSQFVIPSESTLRRNMISFAEDLNETNLNELKGSYVSLLFDSAKRIGIDFEGMIIYTSYRLYFYPFEILERNTASNIADAVACAINDLNLRGIHVVAACSDNASTNIAAFNKTNSYAIQYKIGEGIFRIPCCAHTTELSSGDVFNHSQKGLKNGILFILKTVPQGQKSSAQFSSTRWSSIYKCILFIYQHRSFYSQYPTTKVIYSTIQEEHDWEVLCRISKIMIHLTAEIEKDRASICDVYGFLFDALIELDSILYSTVAQEIADAIRARFTKKGPMSLICAAFLCTLSGYNAFKKEKNEKMKQSIYECALYGVEEYAKERIDYKLDLLKQGFNFYLNENHTVFPSQDIPTLIFWQQMMNSFSGKSFGEFAKLAYEIVQIPCSEAPVERFFSHLEKILSPQRRQMSPQMIRALSIVKMNYLFSEELTTNCEYPYLDEYISKGISGMQTRLFVPPVNKCLVDQRQSRSHE